MKTAYVLSILLSCIFLGCSASSHQKSTGDQTPANRSQPEQSPSTTQSSELTQTDGTTLTETDRGVHLPVAAWEGHQFVLLHINPQFSDYGHHLYTSPRLEKESSPPNNAIETDRHRLLHQPFAGHLVTVQNTKKTPDGEWLVSFLLDTLDLRLYAKTRRGVIEGIALADDLAGARTIFLGDTVFSKKRRIDIYDPVSQSFSNKSISVSTPLVVNDVSWGTTPLPSKPLWVKVSTPHNDTGIIPIHFSTTNTISAENPAELLWVNDILPENPRSYYDWDPYVWSVIDNHNIFVGMSSEQVLLSWGTPDSAQPQPQGECMNWFYNNSTLLFCGDSLVSHTP